jgi:tRNA(fMet)-specific endonuclease VapC
MSFLIDTDICSAHLRNRGNVSSRFLQYTGRLHLSTLTAGELYCWALRRNAPPQHLDGLIDFLSDVTILNVDNEVARVFGEIRSGLLDLGQPVGSVDVFIAATALVHSLTLVTHNTRHFAVIPGLDIVDWLES